MNEPTIYELSSEGRIGVRFPEADVPKTPFPGHLLRDHLPLPELSELDVVRHFTTISQKNYCIDTNFYPLGSCTMKYNPKVNEEMARLPGFAGTHPLQPTQTIQGNLEVIYQLQEWLSEISGLPGVSMQPAAGAQGEFTGVMIIRAYHKYRGETHRNKIIIPDSAHGTNPATSSMSGFEVVPLPSDIYGNVDLEILRDICDDNVAGIMLTNPNTLGLFERQVEKVIEIVHSVGGLVYGDGANLNALLGIIRPGDLGFDVMHFNLHKTFSTPHGGGGPGSGPVAVAEHLIDFLPGPIVEKINKPNNEVYYDLVMPKQSIGQVKSFYGHFGMMIRTNTYIRMYGGEGLRKIAEFCVLNANYLMAKLKNHFKVPYNRICMHEFVLEGSWNDAPEIHALDISKRLIDYHYHPPTNYFPLIVHEALMIEPTETESKVTLDSFADVLIRIAEEAHHQPELLKNAPHETPVGRLDEVKAARELVLCCWLPEE